MDALRSRQAEGGVDDHAFPIDPYDGGEAFEAVSFSHLRAIKQDAVFELVFTDKVGDRPFRLVPRVDSQHDELVIHMTGR